MKNGITLAGFGALGLIFAATAYADISTPLDRRVFQLERDMMRMNRLVMDLQARLDRVEQGGGVYNPGPYPGPLPPPREIVVNCMLKDSGYDKTFLASGRSRLDAEFNVRKACEQSVHPSYCSDKAILKCDDTAASPIDQNFVCMITDTGYSKTFRGEGRTPVEAEGKAKQACQTTVHPSYCGNAEARCEAVFP